MKRITAQAYHEDVDSPQEVITLTGPPKALRGQVTLANRVDEPVFVQSLPLQGSAPFLAPSRRVPQLDVRAQLPAGQTRTQRLVLSLDPHTPPGTYDASVSIGGEDKTLRMIVQGKLDVRIDPSNLLLVGIAPGLQHEAVVQLTNHGNIPVQVPRLKHHTVLDMDVVCRNLMLAIREQGDEGTKATLDAFVRGVKGDLAGWVQLTVKEAGQVVAPGTALLLHLTFKLPDDVHPDRTYQGDVRLFDRLLSYTIMPGPVEPEPAPEKPEKKMSAKKKTSSQKGGSKKEQQ